MYKVVYCIGGSSQVVSKEFKTFVEAMEFSKKQDKDSVLEIKQYFEDEVEETINK